MFHFFLKEQGSLFLDISLTRVSIKWVFLPLFSLYVRVSSTHLFGFFTFIPTRWAVPFHCHTSPCSVGIFIHKWIFIFLFHISLHLDHRLWSGPNNTVTSFLWLLCSSSSVTSPAVCWPQMTAVVHPLVLLDPQFRDWAVLGNTYFFGISITNICITC